MGGNGKKKSAPMDQSERAEIIKQLVAKAQELDRIVTRPPPGYNALFAEHEQIRTLLDQMKEEHVKISSTDSIIFGERQRSKASIDKFLVWCKEQNIVLNNCRLAKLKDGTGLGLLVTKKIQAGELVISVPRNAGLNVDQARRSPMLKRAFERDLVMAKMDNVGMTLWLCCQRMLPDSPWEPYLNVLPSSFSLPLYYSLEELKAIRPSPLFEETLLLYRNISRQFAYYFLHLAKNEEYDRNRKGQETPILYNSPLSVENFTFNLYLWAMSMVATRLNMIPSEMQTDQDGKPLMIPALMPMFDMANHSLSAHVNDASPVYYEGNSAQIVAPASANPTEQFFIYYGDRPSSHFLLYSGFVPADDNKKDCYKLRLALPRTDRYFAERTEFFLRHDLTPTAGSYIIELFNDADNIWGGKPVLQMIKVLVSEGPEREQVDSPANVEKAKKWLEVRLACLRRAYEQVNVDSLDIGAEEKKNIKLLHAAEKAILDKALLAAKSL
ncbi:unnamed protein product, partial [Mesorhabditis spiculigera]